MDARELKLLGLPLHAEVFLENQRDGAAQPGHAVFEGGDQEGRTPAGEHLVVDFGFDDAGRSDARNG